jgi:hypothetical protein
MLANAKFVSNENDLKKFLPNLPELDAVVWHTLLTRRGCDNIFGSEPSRTRPKLVSQGVQNKTGAAAWLHRE